MNIIINLVVIVLIVVVAFWLIGLIAASVGGFPSVAVTLLKVFVVLVALFAVVDMLRGGSRFTVIK